MIGSPCRVTIRRRESGLRFYGYRRPFGAAVGEDPSHAIGITRRESRLRNFRQTFAQPIISYSVKLLPRVVFWIAKLLPEGLVENDFHFQQLLNLSGKSIAGFSDPTFSISYTDRARRSDEVPAGMVR
jgi:hypothetical protein